VVDDPASSTVARALADRAWWLADRPSDRLAAAQHFGLARAAATDAGFGSIAREVAAFEAGEVDLAGDRDGALALLETLGPGLVVGPVPRGLPPVYRQLVTLPPGAAVDLPVLEAESLLFAARHGRPVVNGAGAFTPLYTATLDRQVRNHWLRRTPEDVDATRPAEFLRRAFDARYVIVPSGRRHGLWPLAFAFDRARGFHLVAEAEDGDRIYEIVQ
jgi:hypothetical protein